LNSLSHVASGREKQITVAGGPVVGWFAAVVEWLFDLRIAIYSSAGERLYVNHENVDTQVLLIYVGKPGIHAQVESWTQDSVHAAEVAARQQEDAEIISPIQFGGRIVWNSLLLRVFGQSFYHLNHDESNTLATAIGAAARVLEDHAQSNDSRDFVPTQNQPSPTPFGHSLVQTLTEWLPELHPLQGRIERQLKMPFEEARIVYFQQIHNLQQVCGCGVCATTDANTPSNFTHPHHRYCLTVLVEVIIALGLILSKVAVAAQIYPTRPGIQNFYANQVAQRIQAKNIGADDIREFYSQYLNDSDAGRLQVCAAIFSGSTPMKDVPGNLIALAHEGICVYLAKLEKPEGAARTESGGLIRVVSGAICVRQKVFTRACLGPVADADEFENVWEQVHCAHLSQPLYCK
jgi:hypothetical protein